MGVAWSVRRIPYGRNLGFTIIYYITQYKHSDGLIFRKTAVTNIKKYKVYSRYVRLVSRNYLDITIENTNNTFTFSIYRKPTTTDLIIHNDSCHPTEHKHSAIRCMINRMNTYPISTERKHNSITQQQTPTSHTQKEETDHKDDI
jgi:hypothetical protein